MTERNPGRETRSVLDDEPYRSPLRMVAHMLMFVLAPLNVYRNHVVSETNRIRSLEPADEPRVDQDLLAYVKHAEVRLREIGFSAPYRVVQRDDPKVVTFASLLEHPVHGDIATVAGVRTQPSSSPARIVAAAAFVSEFADGTQLGTSNLTIPPLFPRARNMESVQFPDVDDVGELYRLHRFRVAERATMVPAVTMTRGVTDADRLAYQRLETESLHERLIAVGYHRRVRSGLRPTVRGAIGMAWRGMWPWRGRAERAQRRVAAEIRRRAEQAR